MLKKILALVVAFMVVFSLTACGGKQKCKVCHGSGYYEKKTCVFCNGTGDSDYDPYD